MQKIIITADDYGMCDIVDAAINEGIENGMITTTNVLVNMGGYERKYTKKKVSTGFCGNALECDYRRTGMQSQECSIACR